MMPKKFCPAPGCSVLIDDSESRCPRHAAERWKEQDLERPNSTRRGYDERWRELRDEYLAEHPNCEATVDGRACGAPAVKVHHRIRIKDGGKRLDKRNLQAVCNSCHGKLHAKEGHYHGTRRN